jgi:choline dehydrogenase-like flavoprotein
MMRDAKEHAVAMLAAAGAQVQAATSDLLPSGSGIHEMGTARMGNDPASAVLNKHNQCHAAPNVFVTDGACMASGACQNPSLTYMAITARACDFAATELRAGRL